MEGLFFAIFQNWRRTVLFVFVAALLIRLGFILTLQEGFYFPDSIAYSGAAVSLLTKGELGQYNRPPGYAVFLAAIYSLFGESILAIRIVESLVGAFLAVVIALIGRRIGGEVVGAVAGLVWAIYPMGVFIAGLIYPTNLLTLMLACSVLGILSYIRDEVPTRKIFLLGVLLGITALIIPIILATVGAISLWILYWARTKRLLTVMLLYLGVAVAIVPWMVRDYYVYDELVILDARAIEHLPRVRPGGKQPTAGRVETIVKHPNLFVERFLGNFVRFWHLYPDRLTMDRPGFRDKTHWEDARVVKETIFTTNNLTKAVGILSAGPLWLFALLGTGALWVQRDSRRSLTLLWAVILSFAIGYSIFTVQLRYRIPIEPYIIILSACGMTAAWRLLVRRVTYEKQVETEAEGVRSSRFDARTG